MQVELTMEEQSTLADVKMFVDMNWQSFLDFCESEGLTSPTEDQYEAVMKKATGMAG